MGFLVGSVINLMLIGFIIKKHNWARWVFVVLTVVGVLLYVPVITDEFNTNVVGAISSIIQLSLNLIAVFFLLQRTSSDWVKKLAQPS